MTQRKPAPRLLRFKIALAVPLGRGLAFLGWSDDADVSLQCLNLLFDDGSASRVALDGRGEATVIRTARPRVGAVPQTREGSGFVVWIPASLLKQQRPMLTLNDQLGDVERVQILQAAAVSSDADLLSAYGNALQALARKQRDRVVEQHLAASLPRMVEERARRLGRIEQAWHVAGHLVVIGRLECQSARVDAARLSAGRKTLDIHGNLRCASLATAHDAQGNPLRNEASAFYAVISADKLPRAAELTLQLTIANLGDLEFVVRAHECGPLALADILTLHPSVAEDVLEELRGCVRAADIKRQLSAAYRDYFVRRWAGAPAMLRYADVCLFRVTAAYALEEQGLSVFGWLLKPEGSSPRLFLHSADERPEEVTRHLSFMPATGDVEQLRATFPRVDERLFFVLQIPATAAGGAKRALRLVLPNVPELWLKLDAPVRDRGAALAREMLGNLPASDFLWRNFKPLFDAGLGKALAWAGASMSERSTPDVHQFGVPPRKSRVSVIVPLYGRCDFVRHQLAQFCDDPEFAEVDLIYVVDDPSLHTATLNLASRYQPLFGVPFRVVTYAENRGYAGANNCGVEYARSPVLVLLNSDVLPQQGGWLSILHKALMRSRDSGMAAPLLQFPEGSVQHAGMAAVRQFANPGLIFSHHPGKGCQWDGGDKIAEQPMLTGACLMLRKSDYQAAGGLDEGYIVGDFEDSDFSLRMRSLGKRLYLVPKARLWHLERQSQYLGDNTRGVRDMLTMYNAWRYQGKIAAGLLPDPEQLMAAEKA